MYLPQTILQKFIDFWKEETGKTLSVNEAVIKLRMMNAAIKADKKTHEELRNELIKLTNQQ